VQLVRPAPRVRQVLRAPRAQQAPRVLRELPVQLVRPAPRVPRVPRAPRAQHAEKNHAILEPFLNRLGSLEMGSKHTSGYLETHPTAWLW
jgi:hypothetical protein